MKELKDGWNNLTDAGRSFVNLIVLLVLIVGGIVAFNVHAYSATNSVSNEPQLAAPTTPTYTAQDVIHEINTIRASKGLGALIENRSLDEAAQARSVLMVTGKIRDNSNGDTGVLLTNAGYDPNGWQLQSTWSKNTAQLVAQSITRTEDFALNGTFSEIGAGVTSMSDNAGLLVAVFVSSPKPANSNSSCVDVTSYDYNWNNDVLCTRPDGSTFYTNYAGGRAADPTFEK